MVVAEVSGIRLKSARFQRVLDSHEALREKKLLERRSGVDRIDVDVKFASRSGLSVRRRVHVWCLSARERRAERNPAAGSRHQPASKRRFRVYQATGRTRRKILIWSGTEGTFAACDDTSPRYRPATCAGEVLRYSRDRVSRMG